MAHDPSLGWLNKAREQCNADPAFRKLGSADARIGIKAEDVAFRVTFDAFECTETQEIALDELFDVDFYVDMSRADWQRFLSGRAAGTGATLVGLTALGGGDVIKAESPLKALNFERYHLTLQHFLDKVASLAAA